MLLEHQAACVKRVIDGGHDEARRLAPLEPVEVSQLALLDGLLGLATCRAAASFTAPCTAPIVHAADAGCCNLPGLGEGAMGKKHDIDEICAREDVDETLLVAVPHWQAGCRMRCEGIGACFIDSQRQRDHLAVGREQVERSRSCSIAAIPTPRPSDKLVAPRWARHKNKSCEPHSPRGERVLSLSLFSVDSLWQSLGVLM